MTASRHRAPSEAGRALARELLADPPDGQADDIALVARAELLGVCIPEGLSRWFGPFGALALVSRTLASAQSTHPALRAVSATTRVDVRLPVLAGIRESARQHTPRETADGILEWTASLYDLMGRLIGDDLARSVLTQCSTRDDVTEAASADRRSIDASGLSGDGTPTVKEQ